jgi:hypothetical protein
MPKLKEFLFGKRSKTKQLKTTSPEQDELAALIRQGIESGEGPYADIFSSFNEKDFQKNFEKGVSAPALKNFQDKILPQLQERFIAGNQVLGSGRQRAEAGAATDLQSRLSELMYNARNQQQQQQGQNKMNAINTLYGKQNVENIYKPGTEGIAGPAIVGAAKAASAAVAG